MVVFIEEHRTKGLAMYEIGKRYMIGGDYNEEVTVTEVRSVDFRGVPAVIVNYKYPAGTKGSKTILGVH